jgi:tRNA threonylcarbamoyladenosine biosynthesis protein TsaE
MHKLTIDSATAMQALGQQVAETIKFGSVLHLIGNLGAGKTTFTQGFLRGKGYQGLVKSPTYTIVESYSLREGYVYHFDLYRLTDPMELELMGWRDYFRPDSICIIEWPDKAGSLLPKPDWQITIDHLGENTRQVQIEGGK